MPSQHFTDEKYHMSRPINVFPTQQHNGTQFQMTLRRTHHEPTLTLQLTGSL